MDVLNSLGGVLLTAVAVAAGLAALLLDELKGKTTLKAALIGFCGVVALFGIFFAVRSIDNYSQQMSQIRTGGESGIASPSSQLVPDESATSSARVSEFPDTLPTATINPGGGQVSAQVVADTTFTILADKDWQDTGINVEAGDIVAIKSVAGTWSVSPEGGEYQPTDANGFSELRINDLPFSSLIGMVGPAPPIFIGTQKLFEAYSSGPLKLRINDGRLEDNLT